MEFIKKIIVVFLFAISLTPNPVIADCANPLGDIAQTVFNANSGHVEYCNGRDWIGFPRSATSPICGGLEPMVQHNSDAGAGVAYGAGVFVSVAPNSVRTSPDGITWTARTAPTGYWEAVTYGEGLFVAVAPPYFTNSVMTSPDGVNWTVRTPAEPNVWKAITYGDGKFVAVSHDGANRVMMSNDGITWTAHAATGAYLWDGVAYGAGRFVAIAENYEIDAIMTSVDGVTWTAVSQASAYGWRGLIYAEGQFVAVADGGNRAATSPDGLNWTIHTGLPSGSFVRLGYGGGRYVAVAYDGANTAITSTDGATWSAVSVPGNSPMSSVAYNSGRFVLVSWVGTFTLDCSSPGCTSPAGVAGSIVYHSDHRVLAWCDGAEWNAVGMINPPGPNAGCTGPAGVGGEAVFNSDHCVLQYCDGDNWRAIGQSNPCACGDPGTVCRDGSIYAGLSPDGNVPMFTTPNNAPGMYTWNDGTNTPVDLAMENCNSNPPGLTLSCQAGEANTAFLVGLGTTPSPAPFVAARYCANLAPPDPLALGIDDWYLPSQDELDILYDNRVAIGGFPNDLYWSSSERDNFHARQINFTTGLPLNRSKNFTGPVRCVRK